ncbi:MAG: FadR family transcriptional regulator [Christensenellaceae bacterium]|nr:FadR family transcriptional regulator [Christensenellaceae bacterium]
MEKMLEPLKKTRLYEAIVEQLVELIKDGKLKPGDRLPSERQLSEELQVSRTAIREALRSMESMGYIDSKVGGGTYVKSVTMDSVIDPFSVMLAQNGNLLSDLVDVRMLLEGEIASLAAKKATKEQVDRIRLELDEMKKDIENGGNGLKGDNTFHDMLADVAANSALTLILTMCAGLLSKTREATLKIPGQPLMALADHHAILDAIESHQHAQAATLMRRHLRKVRRSFDKMNKQKQGKDR